MVRFSVGFHKTDTRAAEATAVVDVVVGFARIAQGVDEPAVSRPVAHHAHGRVVAQGRVEGGFDVTAGRAAVDGVQVELRL